MQQLTSKGFPDCCRPAPSKIVRLPPQRLHCTYQSRGKSPRAVGWVEFHKIENGIPTSKKLEAPGTRLELEPERKTVIASDECPRDRTAGINSEVRTEQFQAL